MAAIAADAGVAPKTVYGAFETKGGVLRALWNLLLRGDEDDVPVMDRAWYREVLDEPDPARQLRAQRSQRARREDAHRAVLDVIRHAAPLDPEIAALWEPHPVRLLRQPARDRRIAARQGRAAPGLDVTRATDILWTLNHPDVWQLLVAQRGWTPEQWERWFARHGARAAAR